MFRFTITYRPTPVGVLVDKIESLESCIERLEDSLTDADRRLDRWQELERLARYELAQLKAE